MGAGADATSPRRAVPTYIPSTCLTDRFVTRGQLERGALACVDEDVGAAVVLGRIGVGGHDAAAVTPVQVLLAR